MTPCNVMFHATSGALALHWQDGLEVRLEGPYLRAACKCAECEQQRRDGRQATAGTALLQALQPVGEHGVALRFSDGHARGIYPWAYLRRLAEDPCLEHWPARRGPHPAPVSRRYIGRDSHTPGHRRSP